MKPFTIPFLPSLISPMILWAMLPMLVFALLLVSEKALPAIKSKRKFSTSDWVMNISGFVMQGLVIPLVGYTAATQVFPQFLPSLQGCIHVGVVGAFLLNFVGIDFLYYLQHRAFHQIPWLWKLHAPHHFSPTLNVWATSRNALLTHFLFVYILVNPVLAYLCDSPEGFFAGAMLTAALDLFRHSNTRLRLAILEGVFLLPQDHHRHHDADKPFANYGANFIVWDRLFGTADMAKEFPRSYSDAETPPLSTQLFYPWRS